MKLHLLISAVVLGMAAHIQLHGEPVQPPPLDLNSGIAPQTEPVPKSTPPAASKAPNVNKDAFSWLLPPGKLEDVLANVEKHIGERAIAGLGEKLTLPNYVFIGDSRDAAMTASLRLNDVSPVHALILVCSAAGCAAEPIFAPAEEPVSPGKPQQIIGYRIVRGSAQTSNQTIDLMPAPTQKSGTVQAEGIRLDIAAAKANLQSLREKLSAEHPNVKAAESDLVRLMRTLEEVSPKKDGTTKFNTIGSAHPNVTTLSGIPTKKEPVVADNNQQIVRAYALRGILGGDTKDYGEKEQACEELIAQALDKAGLRGGKERPDLSFHMKSRVLLVKATAAQQEIILQIIEALKENEIQPVQKTGTGKDNNTLPLQTFDDLKEKPSVLTPEVINPNKSGR